MRHRREYDVKGEAETGMMQLHTKYTRDCWQPAEAKARRGKALHGPQREHESVDTLILDFKSPKL